jgi:hypothetical protein
VAILPEMKVPRQSPPCGSNNPMPQLVFRSAKSWEFSNLLEYLLSQIRQIDDLDVAVKLVAAHVPVVTIFLS